MTKSKKSKSEYPVYQKIAADIAAKIVDKHYQIGEKIYARSSVASQYAVSAETARRAICILSDMKIVETIKGSGVRIVSYEKAVQFVKQFRNVRMLNDVRREIISSIDKQIDDNNNLKKLVNELVDKTNRFKSINSFMPFEIDIDKSAVHLGKTISEVNFWHNTTATVVAIRTQDSLVLSPGPYATLNEDDTLYFIGDEECYERVLKFIYSK
ncbi:MAG TPA: GntR family transcriptional regulator [Thermoclostridium sp.]|nr:GntR family transcriptional regulator [Thermoclostridium sp.]